MGLRLFSGSRKADSPVPADVRRGRFGAYFPRLFAYVRCCLDDDKRTREIVIEAFAAALGSFPEASDEEFPVVLFGHARNLCQSYSSSGRFTDDGLNSAEREVISLLFDGQLSRGQIGSLLRMKEESVASSLKRGLGKLRGSMLPRSAPPFLRLS